MIEVQGGIPLKGTLSLPGDKSISHRAIILGAIAEGETVVDNFLCAEDTLATVEMVRQLGVTISSRAEIIKTKQVRIQGVGLKGLQEPTQILDVGNSGTGFRLMLGILAGQDFKSEITGDESIQCRPMKRVTEPLSKMGGSFNRDMAPIKVSGKNLKAIQYTLPVPSAQVKSALLLAGLFAKGATTIEEPIPCRNHTELMLASFGALIETVSNKITIEPGKLTGQNISVPTDISSAAFFIVAGLIIPDSEITLTNVGINPTRTGILEILQQMDGNIEIHNQHLINNEPVADITVRYSTLKGINIGGDTIPSLIDEIPILTAAMSVAKGRSIISDAQELKVKESDRIESSSQLLKSFGAHVTHKEDGLIIEGDSDIIFGNANSFGDHRIAMTGVILGLLTKGATEIQNTTCIATSFPNFVNYIKQLGEVNISDENS